MNKINPQKCVCCGLDWQTRELTKEEKNSNIKPMTYTLSLIVNKVGKRIRLVFCDKHGNNHMAYTKFVKGILHVTNVKTRKIHKAAPLVVAA